MSTSFSLLLLSLPLMLMSYQMSGCQRSVSQSRTSYLQATTSRNLLDEQTANADDSKFSFEKLPNPLKANSQKTALKLIAVSRKVQNLLSALSKEQVVELTGLTIEKMNNIIMKSEKIEQKLLEVNLRLVHSIALQHQGMGLELEDLVYEGVRGLKKALSKFDPEKGFAFSTYAYPWIREYIRAALASSLPIALPRHVYRLLMKVRGLQQQMLSTGREPSDEETAEEMGITIERFEVVRRAMALAARSNDATPALSLAGSSNARIQFDESTWERVVEAQSEGSVLEHVVSNQAQPHAHNERAHSEIRGAVLRALNTLPEDESRAIHERLGLGSFSTTDQGSDRGTGVLRFSEMDTSSGADKETSKALYQKGVRRLRRRASDPKYPEMKALERIFNELQFSSGNILQDV